MPVGLFGKLFLTMDVPGSLPSMTETAFRLIAGVTMLLWASGFTRTGMLRGFGPQLREMLRNWSNNRLRAAAGGLVVTALLQSSFATCLIVGSFTGKGGIPLTVGLAVMLGADVGSAAVVQFLALDLDLPRYILIIVGSFMFIFHAEGRMRNVARILLGLGMILESLSWIGDAGTTIRSSEFSVDLLANLASEPILGMSVGLVFGWLLHSSLVTVLLLASLTAVGMFSHGEGLVLMLGANMGAAIPAVVSLWHGGIEGRSVAVGNFLMKAIVAVVLAVIFVYLVDLLALSVTGPELILYGHLVFNMIVAVLFLPFTGAVATLLRTWMKEPQTAALQPDAPRYLSRRDLNQAALALANASRETMRMGDMVMDSLEQVMRGLMTNELLVLGNISRIERCVDTLFIGVRDYLVDLSCLTLSATEGRRLNAILDFAINLEHAGDIIKLNLTRLLERKVQRNLAFSPMGEQEIQDFYRNCRNSMKLAMNVFLSNDPVLAGQLIAEKRQIRNKAHDAAEGHFMRLRSGNKQSIETSTLHVDLLRDLKRIHGHFVSVAYSAKDEKKGERKRGLK